MQIVREKPCQRLHHRVTAPLSVTLENGDTLIAANWSLGGLRLDALNAPLPKVGDVLSLDLELPFQGFDISFPVQAQVVRTVSETGTIGAKFIDLSERANDLMSHFIDDLIRGKMATVEDTICRIDIPVTPISTQPDANPSSELPVRRLPWKTIFMSAFYLVLGVAVFFYLGFLIFNKTARMEVTSAVVSAPLVHLSMPADGQLIPVSMNPGEHVTQGQRLARVVSSKISANISELKIQLKKDRRNLSRARERLRIETERMKLYALVKRTNIDVARAKVEAIREALSSADKRVARLIKLRQRQLVTQFEVDNELDQRGAIESRLYQAESELEQTVATQSLSDRRHFHQQRFVADLDLLALEVEAANSNLSLTSEQLDRLERQQSSMEITAPFDGRIISVNFLSQSNAARGKPVVTIEKTVAPEITAFLDQDQIVHVGVNDDASVYLPALGKHYKAVVKNIDRNSSAIRPNASHYEWIGDKQKSASVGLLLELPDNERSLVQGGLPAVVVFSKRTVSPLLRVFGDGTALAEES